MAASMRRAAIRRSSSVVISLSSAKPKQNASLELCSSPCWKPIPENSFRKGKQMARAAAKKVKPRKRLTGDERRESILEAALGCFLEKGYIATTINDIREASGATTGSIYHFFDGKGALAMALLEDAIAGWSGESMSSSDTAEATVKAAAMGLVNWGTKNPELFRFTDE